MRVYYAHFLCPSSLLLTRCFKAFSIYFCTARMQAGQGSGLPSSVAVNNYTLLSSYPSQLINHTYTNKIFVMVYGLWFFARLFLHQEIGGAVYPWSGNLCNNYLHYLIFLSSQFEEHLDTWGSWRVCYTCSF
jgi:hypothetical protein